MSDTPPIDNGESILQEAQRLTHGPRNRDYGHPLDDYTRTAALVSAMLAHKLKEPLTAEDAALIMACVKLSRHQNRRVRDNMVDLAGYAWVVWACTEERERRELATRVTAMMPELAAPYGVAGGVCGGQGAGPSLVLGMPAVAPETVGGVSSITDDVLARHCLHPGCEVQVPPGIHYCIPHSQGANQI